MFYLLIIFVLGIIVFISKNIVDFILEYMGSLDKCEPIAEVGVNGTQIHRILDILIKEKKEYNKAIERFKLKYLDTYTYLASFDEAIEKIEKQDKLKDELPMLYDAFISMDEIKKNYKYIKDHEFKIEFMLSKFDNGKKRIINIKDRISLSLRWIILLCYLCANELGICWLIADGEKLFGFLEDENYSKINHRGVDKILPIFTNKESKSLDAKEDTMTCPKTYPEFQQKIHELETNIENLITNFEFSMRNYGPDIIITNITVDHDFLISCCYTSATNTRVDISFQTVKHS